MASVDIIDVCKSFGAVSAVDHLDLAIRDHEFVSFLGPSGCGKTTTLNMVAGLELPTSGTIRLGETDITRLPAMARDVAMVFQSYALYPHMSVAGNLGFALKVRGLPRAAIEAKVRQTAARLGLSDYLDRYPRQLSGGQRQRVALGRALVRDPRLFLLDEPLSNLDAVLRVQTRTELKRLFADLGTTAIYVTHDQAEAMTMSDRIAVFSHGRLQQIGTPLDIYRAPANRFVASFVGSPPMTFLEGTIAPEGIDCGGFVLPPPPRLGAHQGRAVTVGLRAEDVALGPDGVEGRIDLVEHLGSAVFLHVRVGERLIQVQAAEGPAVRRHEPVHLTFDPHRIYVFDPATDAALASPGLCAQHETRA